MIEIPDLRAMRSALKEAQDSERGRGLYGKYLVKRRDPKKREKHKDCAYYVLDLIHDRFADNALEAYATACQEEYPELAADLRRIVRNR